MPVVVAPLRPARRRLSLQLQSDGWLEIWDDRIVTRDQTFTLDESFAAEVTRDWRAPLTVEAQMGLALRDERRRWNIFVPRAEEQLWQALYVLRGVCEARGLALPDLEPTERSHDTPSDEGRQPPSSMPVRHAATVATPTIPTPAKHAYEHEYAPPHATPAHHPAAWVTPDEPVVQPIDSTTSAPAASAGLTSDIVLAAIAHLSVLFLPVILPVTVWLALRRTVPWVAGHAREAARYQAVVWCVGVVLLGSALLAMLLHGSALATVGLLAFITLLAAASVYAFYAVLRATNGDTFRYLDSPRRDHPDM